MTTESLTQLLALSADYLWETDTSLRIRRWTHSHAGSQAKTLSLLNQRLDQLPAPPPMLAATTRTPLTAIHKLQAFQGLYCRNQENSGRGLVLRGVPLNDPLAGFAGYHGVALEMTAEWQALTQARETQILLANGIEKVSDGCALFDAEDRLIYTNSTWRDNINAEIAPLIENGVTFLQIMQWNLQYGLVAEAKQREQDWLKERMRKHRGQQHIFLMYAAEFQWLLVRDFPTDSGGRLIITSDITQLKRREQALAESEERYALAMRGANEGLWDWQIASDQIHLSSYACKIIGVDKQKKLPVAVWFKQLSPPERKRWRQRLFEHLRRQTPYFECELKLRSPSDEDKWVFIHGLAFRSDAGKIQRLAGSISDISERKRLQEKTRQQELQLIQANKMTALGTLVAGVAHEINNPNNLIAMNTDLLSTLWQDMKPILDRQAHTQVDFTLGGIQYAEISHEIPELLLDMRASTRRIEKIIKDLHAFAQPQRNPIHRAVVLNEAAQSAVRLLASIIAKKTAHFTLQLDPRLPAIQGDLQRLEQVIVNLLLNALEALSDPSGKVTLSTYFVTGKQQVALRVKDTGMGIEPEYIDRLCEPFFSKKIDQGGTGLGLAITHTLVKEHRGELLFASTLGEGSEVTVLFPVADNCDKA